MTPLKREGEDMRTDKKAGCILTGLLLGSAQLQAGWLENVTEKLEKNEILREAGVQKSTAKTASSLSSADMYGALKEALRIGTRTAVGQLGREDGFFGNEKVKIPVPQNVARVASTLRKVGMGRYADDFELALNRAAEKAVPETVGIFADAITAMRFEDARKILSGPEDAATGYFRDTSGQALNAAILPIVKTFTKETEVTRYYKAMVGAYDRYAAPVLNNSGLNGLVNRLGGESKKEGVEYDPRDLDAYITAKSLEGLYSVLAAEEKKIRTKPAARTTALLEKVFSRF